MGKTAKIVTLSESDKKQVENADGFGWRTLAGKRVRSQVLPFLGRLKRTQIQSYERQILPPHKVVKAVEPADVVRIGPPPETSSGSTEEMLTSTIDRLGDAKCPHRGCSVWYFDAVPGPHNCHGCYRSYKVIRRTSLDV